MNAPPFLSEAQARQVPFAVPSLERKRLRAYLALIAADVISILAGFAIGGLIYRGDLSDTQALMEAQLFLPLFLTIALYQRVYSIRSLTDAQHAALRICMAVVVAAALLNFLAFYAKFNTSFSRGTFTLGLVLSTLSMVAVRSVSARVLRRRWGPVARNILVLHDGGPALEMDWAVHLDASEYGIRPDPADPHMRDHLAQVLKNQEEVIVSCPAERREKWALILKASGVHGEVISDTAQHLGALGIKHYEGQGCAGLIVSVGPLGLRARVAKRLFDLAAASTALVILSPVLIIAAAAIKLSGEGRVMFVQRRLGRGNRLFSMLKFRTMRESGSDPEGAVSTSRGDERVTRVGAFLRKTSIDELPQLINVLRGEMSIVGPRPHALGSQAGDKLFWEVDGRYWHRHSLKPGMTGLAQVRGLRGSTEQEDDLSARLRSDLEYISNWSLMHDIAIMIRTLTVLSHDRAY